MARPTASDLAMLIGYVTACREQHLAAAQDESESLQRYNIAAQELKCSTVLVQDAMNKLTVAIDRMTAPGIPKERFPDGSEAGTDEAKT